VEFGYRPGYILRLHLKAHAGSAIALGKRQLVVPPRRLAETSFREVTEPCFWLVSFPIDQLRFNRPFADWREVFPNAACVVSLVDRLLHHAEIVSIEGDSYRLKEARERTEQRSRQRRGGKA
jgi:hypothetical protein